MYNVIILLVIFSLIQCGKTKGNINSEFKNSIQTTSNKSLQFQDNEVEASCDFSAFSPAQVSHFLKGATSKVVIPDYPKEAVQQQIQDKVQVKILVDREGNVARACFLSGNSIFQKSAEDAVLRWKFKKNFGFANDKRGRKNVVQSNYVEDIILFTFVINDVEKNNIVNGIIVKPNKSK